MSHGRRRMLIDSNHSELSRQCGLVSISRSTFYYDGLGESELTLELCAGSTSNFWKPRSTDRGRWRVGCAGRARRQSEAGASSMRKMGRRCTSARARRFRKHRVYPYLLRDRAVERLVRRRDVQLHRGFLYLVAIQDWASRKVLSWRLSNTMDASFCVEALAEALAQYGPPAIFNTDQGSQFTSLEFTQTSRRRADSMDGKGRWWTTSSRAAVALAQVRVRLPARLLAGPASAGGSTSCRATALRSMIARLMRLSRCADLVAALLVSAGSGLET